VAQYLLQEQRAQWSPTLSFNAAYNYSRVDNTQIINPFGALFSLTQGLNYGFTLAIPFRNPFLQSRNVQQARIFSDRQQLLFEQQRVNTNMEVQNAFIDYDNARKILLVEEENILLARENVSIAFEVFRRGAATSVELRVAQQSLADAYTRLINARYLAKVAETELLRLNGSLVK
jgi:outer membrane protein TolC